MDEDAQRRLGQAVALLVQWGRERRAREARAATSSDNKTHDEGAPTVGSSQSDAPSDLANQPTVTKLAFEVIADKVALNVISEALLEQEKLEALASGIAACITDIVLDKTGQELDCTVIISVPTT